MGLCCAFYHFFKMSLINKIIQLTFLKQPLKKDQNLVFKTDYRLMQVKSIAE